MIYADPQARKWHILDLFCGAGGAAMGLHRAGFEVMGVDLVNQPRYPFEFHQADALTYPLDGFDAYWASPPCQRFTVMRWSDNHPDLLTPIRPMLERTGKPYIIENVPGAPMRKDAVLCGSAFNLRVRRHRWFESNVPLVSSGCFHEQQGRPITVTGHGGGRPHRHSWKGVRSEWPAIMRMPWATPEECTQAIPPCYSEYLGIQLMAYLEASK